MDTDGKIIREIWGLAVNGAGYALNTQVKRDVI